MQSGKYVGKLVLSLSASSTVMALPPTHNRKLLSPDGCYILVGGFGGIGRTLASFLLDQGARNIVILSRSGMRHQEAGHAVAQLQERGGNILVKQCDVADKEQLAAVVQSLSTVGPVNGVIQDNVLDKMTAEVWNTCVRPKVQGTLNLHAYLPKDLDFFITLSSISAIISNVSQANSAAANTYMDAFAYYRRSLGLRATSLNIGAMFDVGHVAENEELRKTMQRQGFVPTTTAELLALISTAIADEAAPSQIVTGLGSYNPATAMASIRERPLFSQYGQICLSSSASTAKGTSSIRSSLRACSSFDEALAVVTTALATKAAVLCSVEEVDTEKALAAQGLDSLVAVEMRAWISKEFECNIPILELLSPGPMVKLARIVAERSRLVSHGA